MGAAISRLWMRALLPMLLALCGHARADTPIVLTQTYAGNVNFTGTQVTLRNKDNDREPCSIYKSNQGRRAVLSGIPSGATVLGAHLYWAGSAYTGDYSVTMDGDTITAPTERRYYSTAGGNGSTSNTNYFAGAADITAQVKAKGNGDYVFKGLTIQNGNPYCNVEGVVGGFSIVVIYSLSSEPFRVLNVYEGFQHIRYSSFTLEVTNFKIPSEDSGGRIAHVTWEGDGTLYHGGEKLTFNGWELYNSFNPRGNQFNSSSSINGDDKSHGIDFDAWTLSKDFFRLGDTRATTHYESGQDLVLLNAEIVAVPNSPAADLRVTKVRNNDMVRGQNVSYTMTVANGGPFASSGGVVVVDDLPAGLAYVKGEGSGWQCSASGQRVTCNYSNSLSVGASLPALTITARVDATSGTLTNTATVSGKLFDHYQGNNVSTAKGTVTAGQAAYVFTDGPCVDGLAFGNPGQTCSVALEALEAGAMGSIYITALSNGVPAKASKATDVSMQFALQCTNPVTHAGVQATYRSVTLPLCAPESDEAISQWSAAATVKFASGAASAEGTFIYPDVGQVQLHLRPANSAISSASLPFVSKPADLRITRDNGAEYLAPASDAGPVFARAGEPFALVAGAYTVDGKLTPNFGREVDPVTGLPAPAAFATPKAVVGAVTAPGKAAMSTMPKLSGTFGAIVGGKATGVAFSWPEVGVLAVEPALIDAYFDHQIMGASATLGRFVPSHFSTLSAPTMDCVAAMACSEDLPGAVYSGQPFEVTVTALNTAGKPTLNYRGPFARNVTLGAFNAAGGGTANPGAGVLGGTPSIGASVFADGQAKTSISYALPKPWLHTAPPAAGWSAPASVYPRATESSGTDGVTSMRSAGADEGGVRVVSGRLLVPNSHGSERLVLPLKAAAQFWSGARWETSVTDSRIDPATGLDFSPPRGSEIDLALAAFPGCTGALSANGACKAGVLLVQPAAKQRLVNGMTGFTVKAPGLSGSADLLINHIPWLPSTRGRLRFGVYKSPVIYIRETY